MFRKKKSCHKSEQKLRSRSSLYLVNLVKYINNNGIEVMAHENRICKQKKKKEKRFFFSSPDWATTTQKFKKHYFSYIIWASSGDLYFVVLLAATFWLTVMCWWFVFVFSVSKSHSTYNRILLFCWILQHFPPRK